MKKIPKEYEIVDKTIDGLIDELAKRSGSVKTEHVLREILTTAVKFRGIRYEEGAWLGKARASGADRARRTC